jgi:3-polyprenyl-4-hydroxybenzoate decarboxylase and related decarboxylases
MAQAVQTKQNETRAAAKDIRDLRTTFDWFRSEGYLVETDVEVNPDLEITGIQKLMDGALPILFNNVKGYPHLRAVTNLFANMDIVNKMFGWKDAQSRTRDLAHA